MKSVLKNWFQDPKLLNLVSPESKYPFDFQQWKKFYNAKKTITIIIKTEKWIVGHLSLKFKINGETHIFHLMIDPKYYRKGFATKLISEAESIIFNLGKCLISLNVLKNNHKAISLYQKLNYKLIKQKNPVLFIQRD